MKLSTKKMPGGEYQVFLGVIKIAEIHYTGFSNSQGKVELVFETDDPQQESRIYETMIKAIGDLWHLLEQPIPNGAVVVSLSKYREEKEAADMRAALAIKPKTKKKKKSPTPKPESEEVTG